MNFDLRRWAEAELGVPPLPEARSYRALANYLAGSCESAGDMRLCSDHGMARFKFAIPVRWNDPPAWRARGATC